MKTIILTILLGVTMTAHAQRTYTLDECMDSARVHNRTLQNALLDIQYADEQKAEAFTHYFPEISANVTSMLLTSW